MASWSRLFLAQQHALAVLAWVSPSVGPQQPHLHLQVLAVVGFQCLDVL